MGKGKGNGNGNGEPEAEKVEESMFVTKASREVHVGTLVYSRLRSYYCQDPVENVPTSHFVARFQGPGGHRVAHLVQIRKKEM